MLYQLYFSQTNIPIVSTYYTILLQELANEKCCCVIPFSILSTYIVDSHGFLDKEADQPCAWYS